MRIYNCANTLKLSFEVNDRWVVILNNSVSKSGSFEVFDRWVVILNNFGSRSGIEDWSL